jgi:hypothetical protein
MRALSADDGLAAACTAVAQAAGEELAPLTTIAAQHMSADVFDKAANVVYPNASVYCDRVNNALTEKFRTFSGTADLNVEARVSHEHADALHAQLQMYVEAITSVLDRKRGVWSQGVFYAGGYEAAFSPMKRGGRGYVQSARVRLQVHISVD